MPTPTRAPSKEAIDAMPPFDALGPDRVTLVNTAAGVHAAARVLLRERLWGFDTESKPTFLRDQVSDGPHVVQLACANHAWVFQCSDLSCMQAVAGLLQSPGHVLAGFGLRDDKKRLHHKLGAQPTHIVELNALFRQQGYRQEVGVKAAVAIIFGQRFAKSKKAATSNWAQLHLSPAQLLYAANDAWGAYRVAQALGVDASHADTL
jgi:ribonuclease D